MLISSIESPLQGSISNVLPNSWSNALSNALPNSLPNLPTYLLRVSLPTDDLFTYWESLYLLRASLPSIENLSTCVLRVYLSIYWGLTYLINDRVVTEPYSNCWKVFKLYSNSRSSSWTHRAMENEPSIFLKIWKWWWKFQWKLDHHGATEIILNYWRNMYLEFMLIVE